MHISSNDTYHLIGGFVGSAWVVLYFGFLIMVDLKMKGLFAALLVGLTIIGISINVVSKLIKSSYSKEQNEKQESKSQTDEISVVQRILHACNTDKLVVLFLCLHLVGMFSNSYVVYEDSMVSFFSQAVVMIYFFNSGFCIWSKKVQGNKTKAKQTFDVGRFLTSSLALLACLVLSFCVVIRLSHNFLACREEQWTCELSSFLQRLDSLTGDSLKYRNYRFFFSLGCIVCLVLLSRQWMRHYGNLNGSALCVFLMSYAPGLNAACIVMYWALEALPPKLMESLPVWQLVLFPWIVYVLTIITLCGAIFHPLCIFTLPSSANRASLLPSVQTDNFIPQIYNHIKLNWKDHLVHGRKTETQPPVVYGLATVFSATYIVVLTTMAILLILLLGDGLVCTIFLQVLAMCIFLEVHAIKCRAKGNFFHIST